MEKTVRSRLDQLCWETMFGQELVKLIIMDAVWTIASVLVLEFSRALLIRICAPFWCWNLERVWPKYAEFSIAENILHLVNNQGLVWMGMFFAPGLTVINSVKLVTLMLVKSWGVTTANVPHEVVFRASRSNNFFYSLLLIMLFLCTLPVGYSLVWLNPSWHCGPFRQYHRISHIFVDILQYILPQSIFQMMKYVCSASTVIPLLMLLVLVIMYQRSLYSSLKESARELRHQLRHERTHERRNVLQQALTVQNSEEQDLNDRWSGLLLKTLPTTTAGLHKSSTCLSQQEKEENAKGVILEAVRRRRRRLEGLQTTS